MREIWNSLIDEIDTQRFEQVNTFLKIQEDEAEWWKNACLLYFREFSGLDFPEGIEAPEENLEDLMKIEFPYAPGI
jgi:alpha-glucuronidase